ncbi:type II toxin-antitoxin system VapB family antitoxin [Streptomyces sp. NPDC091265]|uniref:type II toxin-antitoxin system VapB family antitoxin n=1 Tax=unclassified Streptomyces TaxID=2593676 RepID=UPI00344BF247
MARYTVLIGEAFVADAREKYGMESDEQAVAAAVEDAAKRLRREEFSDAIRSGEIDFMPEVPGGPGQETGRRRQRRK